MSSSRPCTARVRSVHMQTKAPQLTEGSTTHEKKHHTRTLPDTLAPKTNRGRRGERERERESEADTESSGAITSFDSRELLGQGQPF